MVIGSRLTRHSYDTFVCLWPFFCQLSQTIARAKQPWMSIRDYAPGGLSGGQWNSRRPAKKRYSNQYDVNEAN
jgi:hypothetical protein